MKLSVESNPDKGSVAIMLHDEAPQGLSCELTDTTGKKLQTYAITDPITIIDLVPYGSVELILQVYSKNQLVKKIKIVSHS